MGGNTSKLVEIERSNWKKPHNLEKNEILAANQINQVEQFQKKLFLSYKTGNFMSSVEYQHWFITDGNMVIEFGEGDIYDNMVLVHNCPKSDYTVEEDFLMTTKIKERMKKVCGMTNYSIALRNCEHVARYIQSGVWVSFQMSETGSLRNMFVKEMSLNTNKVNTLPIELQPKEHTIHTIFKEWKLAVHLISTKAVLTTADNDAQNIVVLGPTGCGKSTLINLMFNATINETGSSPLSVTRELQITKGYINICGNSTNNIPQKVKVNVIDTLGFCDSIFTAEQVLTMIKTTVKINVAHIDKVVIICSGRIEGEHAKAIKQFMSWLQYEKYKTNFVFIYNKAECMNPGEKTQAILHMSEMLGASQTEGITFQMFSGDGIAVKQKIKHNLALGFPPSASFEQIKEDYLKLSYATAPFRAEKNERIPVEDKYCTIL